jgi:ATP-dependent RNA helicase RhlE
VHRIGRTGRAGMTGEAISLVSPEDQEAVAAIEKLIKKRIERQFVPNFGPSARTVAGMMGDEPRRKHRPAPPQKEKAPSDPIFSKPYEPSSAPQQPKPEPAQPRRKHKQVAALLGGFKKP